MQPNNPPKFKYTTTLFDFHGVLTSNVGRTVHALTRAVFETNFRGIELRNLLSGMMSREKTETSREYLHRVGGKKREELQEAYAFQSEKIYIPQYSWIIRLLAKQGIKIGIVSNGRIKDIKRLINDWGLNEQVLGIYARGEEGNLNQQMKKPSSEPIEFALDDLGKNGEIDRSGVLFIGDHEVDIKAAKEAGIDSALVVSGPEQLRTIDIKPSHLLTLHHLKDLNSSQKDYHGIPVRSFRDLPKIVLGGDFVVNRETLGGSRSKERI